MSNAVDEIIEDLRRIPKNVKTEVNIKDIADEVSKILQRKMSGRVSQ